MAALGALGDVIFHPWRDRRQLRQPAQTVEADGYDVRIMAFGSRELADRTPIVFLGGAFQSPWSFRHEVKRLAPRWPVLLVDLPGQGQNTQQAPDLGFEELADLLLRVLPCAGASRIHLVGLSYGAGIAHAFASRHPDQVHKLILGGVTHRARPMLRGILRYGLELVDRGDLDTFSFATAHHLFNPSQCAATGVGEDVILQMADALRTLEPEALVRYQHNTKRLLAADLAGCPVSETLIYSARHDNFVMPHEAFEVARRCPRSVYALFTRGDHLLPLQQPDALVALYEAFLLGAPLDAIHGIEVIDPKVGRLERRVEPRSGCDGIEATLRGPDGQSRVGRLTDVTHDGCFVRLARGKGRLDGSEHGILVVRAFDLEVPVVVEHDIAGARCVYLKSSPRTWAAIRQLVATSRPRSCSP